MSPILTRFPMPRRVTSSAQSSAKGPADSARRASRWRSSAAASSSIDSSARASSSMGSAACTAGSASEASSPSSSEPAKRGAEPLSGRVRRSSMERSLYLCWSSGARYCQSCMARVTPQPRSRAKSWKGVSARRLLSTSSFAVGSGCLATTQAATQSSSASLTASFPRALSPALGKARPMGKHRTLPRADATTRPSAEDARCTKRSSSPWSSCTALLGRPRRSARRAATATFLITPRAVTKTAQSSSWFLTALCGRVITVVMRWPSPTIGTNSVIRTPASLTGLSGMSAAEKAWT
mmetsp:Transcript_111254/g.346801  ORF Transcript_111254/g.346801 Transcript_111254/m.346801 type:complete len:295 (+) Transcript_111254:893-1777(+)